MMDIENIVVKCDFCNHHIDVDDLVEEFPCPLCERTVIVENYGVIKLLRTKIPLDDLIEVSDSIQNFLINSEPEYNKYKDITKLPSYIRLRKMLSKYNELMFMNFTIYFNERFNILPKPLWVSSPREFFGKQKSLMFFETVNKILTRNKKINKIRSG